MFGYTLITKALLSKLQTTLEDTAARELIVAERLRQVEAKHSTLAKEYNLKVSELKFSNELLESIKANLVSTTELLTSSRQSLVDMYPAEEYQAVQDAYLKATSDASNYGEKARKLEKLLAQANNDYTLLNTEFESRCAMLGKQATQLIELEAKVAEYQILLQTHAPPAPAPQPNTAALEGYLQSLVSTMQESMNTVKSGQQQLLAAISSPQPYRDSVISLPDKHNELAGEYKYAEASAPSATYKTATSNLVEEPYTRVGGIAGDYGNDESTSQASSAVIDYAPSASNAEQANAGKTAEQLLAEGNAPFTPDLSLNVSNTVEMFMPMRLPSQDHSIG